MTRIDYSDGCDMHCFRSDHAQMRVVNHIREAAHTKHGNKSMESVLHSHDRFAVILLEEVGEVADELNEWELGNRKNRVGLAKELYDVMSVASSWLDYLRVTEGLPVPARLSSGKLKFTVEEG